MTVSELIDLLWSFPGDAEVRFIGPDNGRMKLDEVYDLPPQDKAVVIDFVEPD